MNGRTSGHVRKQSSKQKKQTLFFFLLFLDKHNVKVNRQQDSTATFMQAKNDLWLCKKAKGATVILALLWTLQKKTHTLWKKIQKGLTMRTQRRNNEQSYTILKKQEANKMGTENRVTVGLSRFRSKWVLSRRGTIEAYYGQHRIKSLSWPLPPPTTDSV